MTGKPDVETDAMDVDEVAVEPHDGGNAQRQAEHAFCGLSMTTDELYWFIA